MRFPLPENPGQKRIWPASTQIRCTGSGHSIRVKESVDGRPASRKGCVTGSGSNQPAFQLGQFRKLLENHLFELVFGPAGSIIPVGNESAQAAESSVATTLSQGSGQLGIGLPRRDESFRPDQDNWSAENRCGRPQDFSPAGYMRPLGGQEKRHIAAQLEGQRKSFVGIKQPGPEAIQCQQASGRITAATTEAGTRRDAFLQVHRKGVPLAGPGAPPLEGPKNKIVSGDK